MKIFIFPLISLISFNVMANKNPDRELDLSIFGSYNFSNGGVFSGGEQKNTDTNEYEDINPTIDAGTSYSLGVMMGVKMNDALNLYSSFEYSSPMELKEVSSSAITVEPQDATVSFLIAEIGAEFVMDYLNIRLGINHNSPTFTDNSPDPFAINATGGVGFSVGADFKINETHSIGIDLKALNINASSDYQEFEFDYGDGYFVKRSLLYKYNFGNILD